MLFWFKTIICYVLATITVAFFAIVLSLITMFFFTSPGDDSPALGLLWILVLVIEASLLIPLGLSITAELLQRSVKTGTSYWKNALRRFVYALPIAAGPTYFIVCVLPFREDARPQFWISKEIVACVVTAVSAYFALRISKSSSVAPAV